MKTSVLNLSLTLLCLYASIGCYSQNISKHADTIPVKKTIPGSISTFERRCQTMVAGKVDVPYTRINKYHGYPDTLTIDEIIGDSILMPSSFCSECKITYFVMCIKAGYRNCTLINYSDKLTSEMKQMLKAQKNNDHVVLDGVIITCPDGTRKKILGNEMVIKVAKAK